MIPHYICDISKYKFMKFSKEETWIKGMWKKEAEEAEGQVQLWCCAT